MHSRSGTPQGRVGQGDLELVRVREVVPDDPLAFRQPFVHVRLPYGCVGAGPRAGGGVRRRGPRPSSADPSGPVLVHRIGGNRSTRAGETRTRGRRGRAQPSTKRLHQQVVGVPCRRPAGSSRSGAPPHEAVLLVATEIAGRFVAPETARHTLLDAGLRPAASRRRVATRTSPMPRRRRPRARSSRHAPRWWSRRLSPRVEVQDADDAPLDLRHDRQRPRSVPMARDPGPLLLHRRLRPRPARVTLKRPSRISARFSSARARPPPPRSDVSVPPPRGRTRGPRSCSRPGPPDEQLVLLVLGEPGVAEGQGSRARSRRRPGGRATSPRGNRPVTCSSVSQRTGPSPSLQQVGERREGRRVVGIRIVVPLQVAQRPLAEVASAVGGGRPPRLPHVRRGRTGPRRPAAGGRGPSPWRPAGRPRWSCSPRRRGRRRRRRCARAGPSRMSPGACSHSGLSARLTASMPGARSTRVSRYHAFRWLALLPPPQPSSSTSSRGRAAHASSAWSVDAGLLGVGGRVAQDRPPGGQVGVQAGLHGRPGCVMRPRMSMAKRGRYASPVLRQPGSRKVMAAAASRNTPMMTKAVLW